MISHKGENMARGRMLDKRAGMSKKLGNISDKAARLYFMIYPHLDQEGRIAFDDLEDLVVEIIPYLVKWNLVKTRISLNELTDNKLIVLYPDKKKIAIQFLKFKDFQQGIRKDREAPSKIKNPPNSGAYRISPALRLSLSLKNEGKNKEEIQKKKEIFFDFEKRKFFNITIEDKAGWLDAYPASDIDQEISKMREWLLGNPSKKKKNYRRFITNWLSRAQEKGGSKREAMPFYLSKKDRDIKEIEALAKKFPPKEKT